MNNRAKFSLILGTAAAVGVGLVSMLPTSGVRGTASKAAWGARTVSASAAGRVGVAAEWGKLPLRFEVNEGQAGNAVQYIARGPGYGVLLGGAEATLVLDRASKDALPARATPIDRMRAAQQRSAGRGSAERAIVKMELTGANRAAAAEGLEKLETETNYFIGNDASKWHRNVANYARIRYRGIYPGVDMVYYGKDGRLEYDLKVAAGQNPNVIGMRFTGAERMRVDGDGALVLGVKGSEIRELRPRAYQMVAGVERPVKARYALRGGEVRFELGAYDRSRELVIDPALAYSTYFGGNSGDTGTAIVVDAGGNVYLTGNTSSTNLPTSGTSFQAMLSSGGSNAYVVKLNSTATAVTFCTYIGGDTFDEGDAIAADATGVYVGGITASTNLPGTAGNAQAALAAVAGQANGWLAKLDPNGQNLLYATYLGGGGTDVVNAITVDGSGVVYATGATFSGTGGNLPNFPTTAGVFQATFGGTTGGAGGTGDAFLTKLSADGKTFVYSTYLGGVADEQGNAIVIDGSGNAFVGGETNAQNSTPAFPSPPSAGVIQPGPPAKNAGGSSGWIAEMNAGGTALTYLTYLGGDGDDHIQGMARDAGGNLYVTGRTASATFPVMPNPGAAQIANGGGVFDAFVTKINGTGTAISYSTYLGGSGNDQGADIRVDANGFAYVVGLTTGGFPVTANALQAAIAGAENAFVAKVRANGTQVVYASYHGGNGTDFAVKMALDANSPPGVYFTGSTTSTTFPTTAGVVQAATGGGGQDAFAVKLDASVPVSDLLPAMLAFGNQVQGTTSASQPVTYTNNGNAPLTIASIAVSQDYTETDNCGASPGNTFPNNLAAGASCTINVTFAPVVGPAGADNGTLTATDNAAGSPHTVAMTGTFVSAAAAGSLTPAMLGFGNQVVGTTSASQAVAYKNTGNSPLTINSIVVGGEFTETDNCGASPGNTLPNNLAAGASCTINVSFAPTTLPGGARNGTLTTTDNGTSSPENVALTGTALAPTADVAPFSLVFANQNVGTSSAPQMATLTNNGNSTLNIFSIMVFPSGASDFGQTNNCGATLAPLASCTFTVTFHPIGGSQAGQLRFGDIEIQSDGQPLFGQTRSFQFIDLQGTGVTPAGGAFTLNPVSNAETIHAGQTATFAIVVVPAGGFNQAVAMACTGAPSPGTCVVQPSSLTLNGQNSSQATVIVTTKGRGTLPPQPYEPRGTPPWTMWLAAMMAALAAGMMTTPVRARMRFAAPLAMVILIVGLSLFASACASSGGAGTPTGVYNLTVTGTGGGQTQVSNLTLNVVP